MENKTIICGCGNYIHQVTFTKDNEYKEIYITPLISTYKKFLSRIIIGIKYILGVNSVKFDTIILEEDEREELIKFLKD